MFAEHWACPSAACGHGQTGLWHICTCSIYQHWGTPVRSAAVAKHAQAWLLGAGGSRNQGAAILVKVKALCEAEAEQALHAAALQEAQAALKAAQPAAAQHARSALTLSYPVQT